VQGRNDNCTSKLQNPQFSELPFPCLSHEKTAENEDFKREIHKMFKTVTALEVSNKIRSMKHLSKRIRGNHLL